MQMLTKRMSALVLMACLLAALTFGGLTAWAAEWWPGGGDSLTVEPTDNQALIEDMKSADVVLDVIQIATATPNEQSEYFEYTLIGDYAKLKIPENPTSSDWRALAEEAAKIGKTTPNGDVDAWAKLSDLDDGLYLVLGHSRGETNGLIAHGKQADYEFQPAIVALPSKPVDPETGEIHTDYGPWLSDVTVVLKSQLLAQYGDLKITKTVQGFSGEEATFVFHIVGTTPTGDTYDNYAGITCGASGETTVKHIPVGTKLTVQEENVYTGARYEYVSGDTSEKTIVVNDVVSAAFVNKANGSGKQGHGIQNNFTLVENGDWILEATPKSGE